MNTVKQLVETIKEGIQESLFNPVNYAVISQTIAPDARGGGLGDVGAATDPDVNSQYWSRCQGQYINFSLKLF